jgi:hypothetical protein
MSVDANTGNAFLDSYARQINRLEKDPNATSEFDAALEKQFAAVKAQVLGDAGSTSGSGTGGPAGTHGTGSGSNTTPPPPVADSIGQITSAAGPDAGAAVQKIADGAAASIGGSAGASVAATAAQAGATAAQHVIETGGTPAQAAAAAQTAAQAVATAGKAGGPAAATNVAAIADPATAQSVANTAAHAAETAGGGAVGIAIATAITRAGEVGGVAAAEAVATAAEIGGEAAATAAADAAVSAYAVAGGGAAGEAAAVTAAQAAASAAQAGDGAAEAVAAAAAVGGADAAAAVAAAAAAGGVAAATAASDAAGFAAVIAGGGAAGVKAAVTAARAAADAAEVGGAAAAEAVSTAARVGGAAAATATSQAAQQAARVGGSVQDVAQVAQSTADTIQAIINSGGSVTDAIAVTNSLARAFATILAGGGNAGTVANYAKDVLGKLQANVSPDDITRLIDDFEAPVRAFVVGGKAAEDAVNSAVENAIKRGESSADVTAAAQAVANAAQGAFNKTTSSASEAAKAAATAAETAAEASTRGGAPAAQVVADVYAGGGTTAEANAAADIVSAAAQAGGPDVARNVYRNAHLVSLAGGSGEAVIEAAYASFQAYAAGGSEALDGMFDAGDAVLRLDGSSDDIVGVELSVTQGTRLARFDGATKSQAGAVAHEIAEVGQNARGAPGATADQVVNVVSRFSSQAWAPPGYQPSPQGPPPAFVPPPAFTPGASPPSFTNTLPELATIVAAADDGPISQPSNAPAVSAPDGQPLRDLDVFGPNDLKHGVLSTLYNKLLADLEGGADSGTVQADAQRLGITAAKVGDRFTAWAALMAGSGMLDASALSNIFNSVNDYTFTLNDADTAYVNLEFDIADGADPQTIKADADKVAQLAGDSGQSGLASAASNISNSVTDGSYNQEGSLTALMNNPPASSPPASPPPADAAAYQKLLNDIQSGADNVTIITDAAQLALAAAASGDGNLEYAARNIGNSIGNGSYSKDGSVAALTNAAPGTPGAKAEPQGPFASTPVTGSAYLKLEHDVEGGADSQTVKADAKQVKTLAQSDGNTSLFAAADAISSEIDGGTYSQVGAEEALMNDGATNVELGFSPTGGPSSAPDEASAYQKLLTDIRSGADKTAILNDVLVLSSDAIKKGDFGLSQVAIDIGFSIKDDTFDADTALQSLTGAAPGTAAAQLPPLPDVAA